MQQKKSIQTYISTAVLLCFLWALFFLSTLFKSEQKCKNADYIPDNSNFAIQINTRQLIQSSIFSVILEAKDEDVLRKIKTKAESPGEQTMTDLGINFFSDIVVFSAPSKKGNIIGISFNLINPDNFKTNFAKLTSEKHLIKVVDNVGFLLLDSPINPKKSITKKELEQFFEKHILQHSRTLDSHFTTSKTNKIARLFSKENLFGPTSLFSSSTIDVELLKSGIVINGDLTLSKSQKNSSPIAKKILKPEKGEFHFSTSIVPRTLQDSLSVFAKKINLILPKISSFSCNYKGITIVKDGTGMHPLPEINVLIEFEKEVDIQSLFRASELEKTLGAEFTGKELIIGEKRYYIHQYDPKTVFIGISKVPPIVQNTKQLYFAIGGNLPAVLRIEGGGIITSFLEIVPVYRASKELFDNTKEFDVSIEKINNNDAKIKGLLHFNDGHYATDELLKFLIEITP